MTASSQTILSINKSDKQKDKPSQMSTEADWVKVFDLHDTTMSGALPKAEAGTVLRSCGRLLLPEQMTTLLQKYPSSMTKEHFLEAMRTPVAGEADEKDVLPALRAFDNKECGVLTRFELNQIFCNMEHKLSADEMNALAHGSPAIENDKVDIIKFHEWMARPAEGTKVEIADMIKQFK